MATVDQRIDEFEATLMANFKPVDCPVFHRFVPGMYIREIHMPKGATITSMVHKTMHPFFVMSGHVLVFNEADETPSQEILAPYQGTTPPGTRRILHILEDTVWVTCHVTDVVPKTLADKDVNDAVEQIREQIIEMRENKLLGGVLVNNELREPLLTNN